MRTWLERVAAAVVDPELAEAKAAASEMEGEASSFEVIFDLEVVVGCGDELGSMDVVLSEAATSDGMAGTASKFGDEVDVLVFWSSSDSDALELVSFGSSSAGVARSGISSGKAQSLLANLELTDTSVQR